MASRQNRPDLSESGTIARNKAVVRRHFDEFWNKRRFDMAGDITSSLYVEHGLAAITGTVAERPDAVEGVRGTGRWLTGAFPDLRFEILELIGEGDLVVAYVRWKGTHRGEFQGIPPSSLPVEVTAMHLFRVADGKLTEHWAVRDDLRLMQQIGVVDLGG